MVRRFAVRARASGTAITQLVVGGRRGEPDQMVFLIIELCRAGKTGRRVLPDRVAIFMKEKSGIAGIFRAEVDGAGQKRRAQDRGWPDPQPVFRRDFGARKSEQYHFAEERAFEIEFRANDDRRSGGTLPHDGT